MRVEYFEKSFESPQEIKYQQNNNIEYSIHNSDLLNNKNV